jgi:hypothetical protein
MRNKAATSLLAREKMTIRTLNLIALSDDIILNVDVEL